MQGEVCKKCGEYYEDPSDGFYWEKRKHGWRRPCKKCISKYNKTPDQKETRYAANKRYRKSSKGRESMERAHANRMKKYHQGRRR